MRDHADKDWLLGDPAPHLDPYWPGDDLKLEKAKEFLGRMNRGLAKSTHVYVNSYGQITESGERK